jgi:hypothetical protein
MVVRNGSDQPIYQVTLCLDVPGDGMERRRGDRHEVLLLPGDAEYVRIGVRFADEAVRWWTRRSSGLLELDPPPRPALVKRLKRRIRRRWRRGG